VEELSRLGDAGFKWTDSRRKKGRGGRRSKGFPGRQKFIPAGRVVCLSCFLPGRSEKSFLDRPLSSPSANARRMVVVFVVCLLCYATRLWYVITGRYST